MSKQRSFTLSDLRNTAAAKLNPHLFGEMGSYMYAKETEEVTAKQKYNNKKVVIDGIEFDSKKEGNRYMELKGRQMAGEITDLRFQREYELVVNGEHICTYVADFEYKENGSVVVEDVKSKITRKLPVYRIKNKLMEAIYNIKIKEV
jgi:hypothetical protein